MSGAKQEVPLLNEAEDAPASVMVSAAGLILVWRDCLISMPERT